MDIDPVLLAAQEQVRAAWVQADAGIAQAIGAVLALATAIGVPLWLRQKEQDERAEQSRSAAASLALALLPSMNEWIKLLETPVRTCRDAIAGNQLHTSYSTNLNRLLQTPQPLATHTAILHSLGAMAPTLQAALIRATWLQDNWQTFDYMARLRQGVAAASGKLPEYYAGIEEAFPPAFIAFHESLISARKVMRETLAKRAKIENGEVWRILFLEEP